MGVLPAAPGDARYGIVCGAVTRRKLRRLQKRIGVLRGSPRKAKELETLAKAFGRKRAKRGKEPTWVSQTFPHLRPLSIPRHPGDLKRWTTESILDHLERFDVAAWQENLRAEEDDNDNQNQDDDEE